MRRFVPLLILLTSASIIRPLAAQDRLLDQTPFDEIQLDEDNENKVITVFPLELPDRQLPAKKPAGVLRVQLIDRPGEDIEIAWNGIVRIRFFEQRLFEEAQRLTTVGEFDEAYFYFERLLKDHPKLPGLDGAVDAYLQKNALAAYQKAQYDKALGLLTALYDRNPTFPGLARALEAVTGRMIDSYLKNEDYVAAHGMVKVWKDRYQTGSATGTDAWEQRFQAAAAQKLADADQLFRRGQFLEARKQIGRAKEIWEDVAGARELLARIDGQFPQVLVGVFERTPRDPTRRIDNWAAMRTSRLVAPTIVELYGFGAEGGLYRTPLGELQLDETGRRLKILGASLAPSHVGELVLSPSHALARYLVRLAEPDSDRGRGEFEAIVDSVSVDAGGGVEIEWARRHVRPEAMLQFPLPPEDWEGIDEEAFMPQGPFKLTDSSDQLAVFEANDGPRAVATPKLSVIFEETFGDDEAAVKALARGEIDVLDRVPPWHLARLRTVPGIRVDSYCLPTVHVLIPNFKHPLSSDREYRRALCYAIDRERFVRQVLLGGKSLAGYETVSSPFPTGRSLTDPVRYALNSQVQARPFDPRLASILMSVAWTTVNMRKGKLEDELPPLPKLVIVHPADPIARTACETIKRHLRAIGFGVTVREISTQELVEGDFDYDLRYAELAVWEPVVDAWTLFAPDGLAGYCTHPMNLALRQLESASNWADVRARLAAIHQLAHNDLPLIPLWQTVNYFAYRTTLEEVGESPVVLYQNAADWHKTPSRLTSRQQQ